LPPRIKVYRFFAVPSRANCLGLRSKSLSGSSVPAKSRRKWGCGGGFAAPTTPHKANCCASPSGEYISIASTLILAFPPENGPQYR